MAKMTENDGGGRGSENLEFLTSFVNAPICIISLYILFESLNLRKCGMKMFSPPPLKFKQMCKSDKK